MCLRGCGGRIWTDDLRVMSPTSYQLLYPATSVLYYAVSGKLWPEPAFCQKNIGAGDRGRTGTIGKDRRILSPVRLPIPPLRQVHLHFVIKMAPREGLEPSTLRLTAACSTIELPRNTWLSATIYHRQHKPLYRFIYKKSSIFFKYFHLFLYFFLYIQKPVFR